MSKITLTGFALLSVLFFGNSSENYAVQPRQNASDGSAGTLQKMIVENGSVTLNLDLNGLNGSVDLTTRPVTLQFAAGTNSFLPILVLNGELRGLDPGSIALVPQSAICHYNRALAYDALIDSELPTVAAPTAGWTGSATRWSASSARARRRCRSCRISAPARSSSTSSSARPLRWM